MLLRKCMLKKKKKEGQKCAFQRFIFKKEMWFNF